MLTGCFTCLFQNTFLRGRRWSGEMTHQTVHHGPHERAGGAAIEGAARSVRARAAVHGQGPWTGGAVSLETFVCSGICIRLHGPRRPKAKWRGLSPQACLWASAPPRMPRANIARQHPRDARWKNIRKGNRSYTQRAQTEILARHKVRNKKTQPCTLVAT